MTSASNLTSSIPIAGTSVSRFISVDHNTILNRERFKSPVDLGVQVSYVLEDSNKVPLKVVNSSNKGNNPLNIVTPEFVHDHINENYLGQLSIPSLGIVDSFYFSGDDYYLRKNWQGKNSNAGELYIDGRSSGNLFRLDNLINGHNMNNLTKFGKMKNIIGKNETVYVFLNEYTTGKTFIYKVFAANVVLAEETGVRLNFSSSFVRQAYYQQQIDKSVIASEAVDLSAPILTLNTCDNTLETGHLLIFATLVGWTM